jgi:hypothetical protein
MVILAHNKAPTYESASAVLDSFAADLVDNRMKRDPPAQPSAEPVEFDRPIALILMTAAAKSGNEGAMRLAAQLAGAAPCEKCGYVNFHCRCAAPPTQPSAEPVALDELNDMIEWYRNYRKSGERTSREEMMELYEMDDVDRALVVKMRKAIAYEDNGDPAKDVIDYDEMIDAMRLLLQIIDAGCAA